MKEGFIQRKNLVPILQKRTQKRQRVVANGEVEDGSSDETSLPLAIVADHAWLVLDWLVSLFEKDEKNAKTPDGVYYAYDRILLNDVPSQVFDPSIVTSSITERHPELSKGGGYSIRYSFLLSRTGQQRAAGNGNSSFYAGISISIISIIIL